MLDKLSIPKRSAAANEHGFDALKEEGIELLQGLSGNLWTDYNLHDPGVTILEHLCYALTDLIYRTGMEMADYLTAPDGRIDFENQALFRPEVVFPNGPLTVSDYRKLFIDAVPEIDNVWVIEMTGDVPRGLYRIYAQLAELVEEREGDEVSARAIERIRDVYAANRNLGEDLEDVLIVGHSFYSIHGAIETEGDRPPSEILAELYFRASQLLASNISSSSFEEMLESGKTLEEIFTGPLTIHGYIDNEGLDTIRQSINSSDLIEAAFRIDGLRYVERLWFQDEQGEPTESIPRDPLSGVVPRLRVPPSSDEGGIILRRNGRELKVSPREVHWEFNRRSVQHLVRGQIVEDLTDVSALPAGTYRDLRKYFSVQDQFPGTYGINRYGLPESATMVRKAQAKNLKAYLWFFEQVMANFQENLAQFPRLFSLDGQLRQSYFHQMLTNENLPDVDCLYQDDLEQSEITLGRILERHDNFGQRRNRVLDFLLGIYGESFAPDSFLNLEYYSDHGLDYELAHAKINLLKAIGNLA